MYKHPTMKFNQSDKNKSPQKLPNPSKMKQTFINLFVGTSNSWGNISKNVTYRKVPPAMPKEEI